MIGTTLLHYRIVRRLGSGGMGEVYAADDTKLHRLVALKILPPAMAADPDRLSRFRREAQAIAALNHPNVVTVYSVEDAGGTPFLTMELVEGETLSTRLRPEGLQLKEFLALAQPLVDAVVAAHAQGVVHRDLKPSNVMVGPEGRVKVLDFGLAKLQPHADAAGTGTTVTSRVTAANEVFGTPSYMSPEQAEGRTVDQRTDIFSLGVLLYEMACGSRPFTGDTSLAVISSILKDTPRPLAEVRPDLPPEVDRIVRRCLAKDPTRRYQSAIDLRNDLDDLEAQLSARVPVAKPARGARAARWVGGAVAAVAALALGYYALSFVPHRNSGSTPRMNFTQVTSQPAAELFSSLSPDGKWVVYGGEGDGNRDVFLQSTSGQTPIDLTRDSPADDDQPAFSPDGERIAFRSSRDGGGIFVMGRTGEAVRRVTREGFNPAWSPDGTQLVYSTVAGELKPQNAEQRGRLMVVPVNGGVPRAVYDQAAMLPSWSPHGLRISLSGRVGVKTSEGSANIVTIDPAGNDLVPVTSDQFLNWNPVWSPAGNWIYYISNRGGSMNIWRVAIDEASGRPRGEAQPITTPAPFVAHLSIAAGGSRLAYSAVLETQNIQRLAFDPVQAEVVGSPVPVTTGSRFWANPDPSPDGASIVLYSQVAPEGDLYVTRTDGSGVMRQVTSDRAIDRVPRWSPDGNWIAMFSDRSGTLQTWLVRADGSDLRQVTQETSSVAAWSPDGQRLAVTRQGSDAQRVSASIVDPFAPADARTVIDLPPAESSHPRFAPNSWSPDGKWLAGQNGFTTPGVSVYSIEGQSFSRVTEIGEWPVWLPDSRRILYIARGREFHVVDARTRADKVVFSVKRDTLGSPRLTRNGRAAFFSRRVTEADVWIVDLGQ